MNFRHDERIGFGLSDSAWRASHREKGGTTGGLQASDLYVVTRGDFLKFQTVLLGVSDLTVFLGAHSVGRSGGILAFLPFML